MINNVLMVQYLTYKPFYTLNSFDTSQERPAMRRKMLWGALEAMVVGSSNLFGGSPLLLV